VSFASSTYIGTINLQPDNEEIPGAIIKVVGAKDIAGNTMVDDEDAGSFAVDTIAPTAVLSNKPSSGTTATTEDVIVGGEGVAFYKYKLDGSAYSSPAAATAHLVLSALSVGSHVLKVVGGDSAGNWQNSASSTDYSWAIISSGGGGGGGGGAPADTAAPVVSDVNTAANATSAVIVWKTNESSFSWIIYGTSTSYGKEEKKTSYLTSHSIILSSLFASTTYHYKIKSQDPMGNIGTSSDKIFTTLSGGMATTSQPEVQTSTVSSVVQSTISQMTREQLIALILQILAARGHVAVAAAGGTIGAATSGSSLSGIPAGFIFQASLKLGINLIDVKYLQIVLNSDPATRIALKGFGSPGYETIYFGNSTMAAVKKFQTKYAIASSASAGYGLVGPSTRAKLNSLLGK
jgi:hypothetical protein